LRDLGLSETAKYYGITDKTEAQAYLNHPVLGSRLIEISKALIQLQSDDAHSIFGSPDDMKLKSSMTLFGALPGDYPVFQSVLDKFYDGDKDLKPCRSSAKPTLSTQGNGRCFFPSRVHYGLLQRRSNGYQDVGLVKSGLSVNPRCGRRHP
jgi:hypothetical protein